MKKTNQCKVIIWALLFLIILWIPLHILLCFFSKNLCLSQYFSFFCFWFLCIWWTIYFLGKKLELITLRQFIEQHCDSIDCTMINQNVPNPNSDNGSNENSIINKSSSSIAGISIVMAVIALMFSIVSGNQESGSYYSILKFLLSIFALVTITLMVISVDILDTISNDFIPGKGIRTPNGYRKWFYEEVGTFFPKGAHSYTYLGYASFFIFFIMAFAFFDSRISSVGVAFYTYLSYPYLFGYYIEEKNGETHIEPREGTQIIPLIFLFFFLICFLIIIFIPEHIGNKFLNLIGIQHFGIVHKCLHGV